jgi:hypothetical protein
MCIIDNTIHIKVNGDNRLRKIGTVIPGKRILVINRLRSKHEFKKAASYGFNYYVLKNIEGFDTIKLCDEYGIYNIPVEDILAKSLFLHFKKTGFERQIFMKISDINKYRDAGKHFQY